MKHKFTLVLLLLLFYRGPIGWINWNVIVDSPREHSPLIATYVINGASAQSLQSIVNSTDIPNAPVDSNSGGGCTGSSGAWTCTGTPTITLVDATASFILQTTNGSTPACPATGTLYSAPFAGPSTTFTLKAIGCNGVTGGGVLTSVYTINLHTLPVHIQDITTKGGSGAAWTATFGNVPSASNAEIIWVVDSTGTTVTGVSQAADGLVSATYVSGGSTSGTGNCAMTSYNNGLGSANGNLIAVAGGVFGAITVTVNGSGATSAPTTVVVSNGTATCSGTITISSVLTTAATFSKIGACSTCTDRDVEVWGANPAGNNRVVKIATSGTPAAFITGGFEVSNLNGLTLDGSVVEVNRSGSTTTTTGNLSPAYGGYDLMVFVSGYAGTAPTSGPATTNCSVCVAGFTSDNTRGVNAYGITGLAPTGTWNTAWTYAGNTSSTMLSLALESQ